MQLHVKRVSSHMHTVAEGDLVSSMAGRILESWRNMQVKSLT